MPTGVPEAVKHATNAVKKPSTSTQPPIAKKMFTETHPLVTEKDKSIHSSHGVIHYPFYYGGFASFVSVLFTQPLGVDAPPRRTSDGHDARLRRDLGNRWHTWAVERRTLFSRFIISPAQTPELTLSLQLSASLTRTVVYSGVRFGMYEKLKEMSTTPTHSPTFTTLAGIAAASGASGSILSNWSDIVCLRMQRDPGLPIEQRRNYRNLYHGLTTMVRQEGWSSIWTAADIGAARAAVATAAQLAGYDVFKRELMKRTHMKDDVPTHITASCLAGFLSTLICNPLDAFKARIMTNRRSEVSMPVMLKQIFRTEGAGWMFKGLTPALISRGPSTIITFVTLEQCKAAYRRANRLEE